MDALTALFLAQDGIVNGAAYALLGLSLVLVYAVTRVVFIPQGAFVVYGALTLATIQSGKFASAAVLLLVASLSAGAIEARSMMRGQVAMRPVRLAFIYAGLPALVFACAWFTAGRELPLLAQLALTLAIVVPLGPLLYRIVFQPVQEASVLVLLIVAVAMELAMVGVALILFGAEGARTAAFSDVRFTIGKLIVPSQTLWVIASTIIMMGGLFWLFSRTIYGKALRATAVNRVGARLAGISTTLAGRIVFTLAALMGAFSGILISPITVIYYDSGFLIGLKGFVAAIVGGMVSYPIAAAGALLVGLLESFSSFWASAFKEVIVFTLIIPVLLWRSLTSTHVEEDH
jgi:branched-chain amino acid transport system permease protein